MKSVNRKGQIQQHDAIPNVQTTPGCLLGPFHRLSSHHNRNSTVGFHTQKAGLGTAPTGQIADHAQAMKTYLIGILSDWALLAYCWAGAAFYGGDLKSLSGGRWRSLKEVWS
ncbi:MAG TPA: hypothetical protein VHA33_14880 [Candidatus Angelobacter sp.]|nr:hypothetical protein [Candidatus Angelobacter sp.]